MANVLYNAGADELRNFTSDTVRALLLQAAYVADPDHVFVSALSSEVTASGYSRQTLAGKSRTVDNTLNRITYDCNDPAFGTLVTGQTVAGMAVYKFVTNDADSILLGYFDLVNFPTNGTPYSVAIAATGLFYVTQG